MKLVLIGAIVVGLLIFVSMKNDSDLENLNIQKEEKIVEKSLIKNSISNEQIVETKKVVVNKEDNVIKNEKRVVSLPPSLPNITIKKDNPQERAYEPNSSSIEGYQAVYEYIQENRLEPLYGEQKTLSDGTPFNIYVEKKEEVRNSFAPPQVPTFAFVQITNSNGTKEKKSIVLKSGTDKVTIVTGEGNNQKATTVSTNTETESSSESTNTEESVKVIKLTAPPSMPNM